MKTIRLVEYIRQYAATSRRNKPYKNKLRNLALKLERFESFLGKDLYTFDFEDRMMEEFDYFLRNEPQNYRRGTIKGFGQKTSEFLNKARKDGYEIDERYKDYSFPKAEIYTVALTEEEVYRIFNLKRLSQPQKVVRFWFLLSCCTGLRYSDIVRVKDTNFFDDKIVIRTQKTNNLVVLPLHYIIKELLKDFKGELPNLKTQQNFNKIIKSLCRSAQINDKILIERHEGTKFVRKTVQKWQIISHHTGRRTFATNAYLAGIPTARIMLLTGHKTEEAFFKYIQINKTENASLLSEHPFFLKKE